jgi:hypothetical protein
MRGHLYKIGPEELVFTRREMINRRGEKNKRASRLNNTSKPRFMKFWIALRCIDALEKTRELICASCMVLSVLICLPYLIQRIILNEEFNLSKMAQEILRFSMD